MIFIKLSSNVAWKCVDGGMVRWGEGRILQFWADKGGDMIMMGNKGETCFHMNLGHPFPTFISPIQKYEGLAKFHLASNMMRSKSHFCPRTNFEWFFGVTFES